MSKKQDIAWLRSQIAQIEASSTLSDYEAGHSEGPLLFGEQSSSGCSHLESQPFETGLQADADDDPQTKPKKQKASAFERVVSMTSKRFRSEHDVRQRLQREQYSDSEIDDAVSRAINCLLIDDLRYADVLIRSRIRTGKGRQGIELELRREGIDVDLVPGWPYDYFSDELDDELDRAVAFLESHPPRSKNLRQSAYRKLVQKGYSSSIASTASRLWIDQA